MSGAPLSSAWQAACNNYSELAALEFAQPRAAYFAGFGALHVAVAELLYERSDELDAISERRVVHIENATGLLAAYSPSLRKVQLRSHNTALAQLARSSMLNVRVLPASAGLLDGAGAHGFQTWPVAALFWHYGQDSPSALGHLPQLAHHRLLIRRFPMLDPSALMLRQLQLIHLISRHTLNFEQLLPLLREGDRAYICPDLASLYFSGTLRISKA